MADSRLATSYVEVLTSNAVTMQFATTYVEVLTPSTLTALFRGWGNPI